MKKDIINKLNKRIIEISIKHRLSHLGSCLTTLPIIYDIFEKMNPEDKFVLSNGHAGLAYYVVLEYFKGVNAEELLEKYGIHPERDLDNYIDVSTGSLGLGLTIATGIAFSNPSIKVYCIISDGECAEGSIWEALRVIDEFCLSNIEVHANINGWSAYKAVDSNKLSIRLRAFLPEIKIHFTDAQNFLNWDTPLQSHYKMATENMLTEIKKI